MTAWIRHQNASDMIERLTLGDTAPVRQNTKEIIEIVSGARPRSKSFMSAGTEKTLWRENMAR